jgi:hypothetical protein
VLQGNCHNLKNFEKLGCELRVAAIGNVAGVAGVAVVAVVVNVGGEAGVIREMGQLPSINVGNDRMVGVGLAPTPRYCGVRVRVRVAGCGLPSLQGLQLLQLLQLLPSLQTSETRQELSAKWGNYRQSM